MKPWIDSNVYPLWALSSMKVKLLHQHSTTFDVRLRRSSHVQHFHWEPKALEQAFGFCPPSCSPPLLLHPLSLSSAYHTCLGHEPAYTAANCRTSETVDYIVYCPRAIGGDTRGAFWEMHARGALDVPLLADVAGGGPSGAIPSDHICLVADFDVLLV
jgi:hypothetical protein